MITKEKSNARPNFAQEVQKLNRSLKALHRKSSLCAETSALILWYVSGNDPRYKPVDGRAACAVKKMMVNEGLALLAKDANLTERSAAKFLVRKFKDIPGGYDSEEALHRQLNRKKVGFWDKKA